MLSPPCAIPAPRGERFTAYAYFIVKCLRHRVIFRLFLCTVREKKRTKMRAARAARLLASLSTRVFETRTANGRENFACQDSGVSQIFILIISNGEKILSNVNVVV